MNNLILNIPSLKLAVTEGKFDLETLCKLLSRPDLIGKIRYIDSAGRPWGEWDDVCAFIESHAKSLGYFERYDLNAERPNQQLINKFYVFSKIYAKNRKKLLEVYCTAGNQQAVFLLSKADIFNSLIDSLEEGDQTLREISPTKFLLMLLRATAERRFSIADEVSLIEKYFSDHKECKNNSDMVCRAISSRLLSLLEPRSFDKKERAYSNNDIRLAVFICGQCRVVDNPFSLLVNALQQLNCNFDLFVSTWRDLGGWRVDPSKLSRHLTPEAIDYLSSKGLTQHQMANLATKIRGEGGSRISEQEMSDLFSFCPGDVYINIKNDLDYPYNEMDNSEKMYYHNSFWIRTLGRSFFEKKYSHLLKIRPDIDFSFLKNCFDLDNTIVTEEKNGWVFREWGFGVGDQVVFGDIRSALSVMDLHCEKTLVSKLVKEVFGGSGYRGHINIGLMAWIQNLNVEPNIFFKSKILSQPRINLNRLLKELP